MSNFVGYVDGYKKTDEDSKWDFVREIQDVRFKGKDNAFIKKERHRLAEVVSLIKSGEPSTEANELLRQIFKEHNYDIEGKDNEFCYALGDKLNAYVGLPPLISYVDE